MQTADFNWFVENIDELYKEFGACYLSIQNKKVLGRYNSYAEAVNETSKSIPLGTFIVQKCGESKEAYTNYISSMNFID